MIRWPLIPVLIGTFLFLVGAPPAPADQEAPPALSGVLRSDAAIDPASVVLAVDGRVLYTAAVDRDLEDGPVFEIEWLDEAKTAAAWTFHPGPNQPAVAGADHAVELEFRDRAGRAYAVQMPQDSNGVFRAAAGPILEITDALVFPNPFNPFLDDATIQFDLNMDGEVKIQAYDWAGEFVDTVFEGAGTSGTNTVEWGGQTEDGRKLGNGMYLIRIRVTTLSRTESEVLKAVIWNED